MSIRSEFVRLWNEFMANAKKITQLTSLPSPVANSDLFEVVRGGVNYKALGSQLPSGGGGGSVVSVTGPTTDNTDPTNPIVGTTEVTVFKTASAVLAASDAGKLLEFNVATPNTITFPLNATVAIPVNSIGTFVYKDAATTVVKGDPSIVINSSSGDLTFPAVNAPVVWKKTGVNEWYLWNGPAGVGGIDDVLAEAQALTDDRDITIGDHVYRETADDGTLSSQVQIDPSALGFIHNEAAGSAILSLDSEGIRVADTIENRGIKGQANFSANIQANDFAQKNYVDNLVAGLKWKTAVRVATTNADSGSLSNAYENGDTIDGVVLVTGDRILIKDQADSTEDGIYIVAASGTPSRATDADTGIELEAAVVSVEEGTENGNTTWRQNADNITLGVTNIDFQSFGTSSPDASETVKGIVELATQAEVTTGTDDVRAVTPLKLAVATRGVQDLFISASAMWPRTTGPCADLTKTEIATSLFNIQSLDFDQTTQEFCQFQIVLPRKWNNGTVTAVFYWTAAAGSGTVQFGISGGAYSNDDALTVAFGTAQTADDILLATNDLHISPATSAITLAGTPADADFLAFQISRNPASDTLNADAKLLGVSIRLTTDSALDA